MWKELEKKEGNYNVIAAHVNRLGQAGATMHSLSFESNTIRFFKNRYGFSQKYIR